MLVKIRSSVISRRELPEAEPWPQAMAAPGIFRKVKCTLRPHYVQSAVIRPGDAETLLDSYAIRFLSVEPSIEELSKKN